MKMEQTMRSETSAYKIQKPGITQKKARKYNVVGNYPEESTQIQSSRELPRRKYANTT